MNNLELRNVSVQLADQLILDQISLSIQPKSFTAIIGPNGSGKSTLLRSLARLIKPKAGYVSLDGTDIWKIKPKQFAHKIAFMPQTPLAPEGLLVRKLIERGRTPYLSPFQALSKADESAVTRAIKITGLEKLEESRVDRLSGGQRQRAWISLALAQDTPFLLLDEPTSFLDLSHQIDVLGLIQELNNDTETTVIMVLHDINLACRFANQIIAIKDGRLLFQGAPSEVITEGNLKRLYGIEMKLFKSPELPFPMTIAL